MSTSITKQGILLADGVNVGDNLVANSIQDAGQSHTTYAIADFPFTEPLVEGETYSVGIKINVSDDKQWFGVYHSGGTYRMAQQYDVISGTYQYSFTATADMASRTGSTYGYGFARVYASNNNGVQGSTPLTGTANVDWIKIEKGSIATPWTPSSVDSIYAGDHGFFEGSDKGSISKGYMEGNEFYEY